MSTPIRETASPIIGTEEIRKAFPALERRHNGFPVAYFDGAGGTQTPHFVVNAVADYLLNHNANTHWEYPTSHETDAIIESARHSFADFLNASANEIVFGPNTTTMIYHLSRALGRRLGPGDEIVTTELEHHATTELVPRMNIAAMMGADITTERPMLRAGERVSPAAIGTIVSWKSVAATRTPSIALGLRIFFRKISN